MPATAPTPPKPRKTRNVTPKTRKLQILTDVLIVGTGAPGRGDETPSVSASVYLDCFIDPTKQGPQFSGDAAARKYVQENKMVGKFRTALVGQEFETIEEKTTKVRIK